MKITVSWHHNFKPLSFRDTATRHELRPTLVGNPTRMSMGHTGNFMMPLKNTLFG